MSTRICLNADVGELPGDDGRALDRAILDVVTRCNIACGGHAGDDESMAATIHAAVARNVLTGAHPSYPDREGFGRARPSISNEALEQSLLSQVRTLKAIAHGQGATVAHLKPHGSLYNDAAKDESLAEMVVSICLRLGIPELLGPPESALEQKARNVGLVFAAEAFADRSYEADGHLTPRALPGAVMTDEAKQLEQALSIIVAGEVSARTGERVRLRAETICLHGDTPGAAGSAFALKKALMARGIEITV
ncbi:MULTISPECIES: 5-oxoprolinase subunit PxpA [Hyphomonas]|uniref:LamB/YcsF family protein n=1 Tax=Hyphomonas adhaerens TaxID=81029 RepID=A0A3B9GU37_9PROT|nr:MULTISPECIES: 5-oxoprolinase subunit PxpA [Hyphomonas]MBB40864.1 hypothetical protein [Hyphomonas sp.]HAE25957.1 LamB/YcsF family protein [Hyphomonas adhaerens]|tara:strand:+ start:1133 stop:1885 length:753 start_codon:yes stop_codon:yes gene_type:complete